MTGRLTMRSMTLEEVRGSGRIASGYETSMIYVLERVTLADGVKWTLQPSECSPPFRKEYDNGDPKDWLEGYFEEVPPERLRFAGAWEGERLRGLATYADMTWNDSVWLLDIRVDRGFRRSGTGSLLMGAVKEHAVRERMRGISVETQINNTPAVAFYVKHRFEISGFNDHLYGNDDLDRQDVALYLFWEAET